MPSNFQWQAEDEADWADLIVLDPKPKRQRRAIRTLAFVGSAVSAVLITLLIAQQLGRQVAETTSSVESDVNATHQLILQAARSQDLELFTSFLSGRSPEWTSSQIALVEQGLFLERPMVGELSLESGQPEISVELSADLREAEVSSDIAYSTASGSGERQSFRLSQVYLYRKGGSRWLLAPPDQDFWGNSIEARGRYLTLTYYDREGDIGRRLAADLEAALGSACSRLSSIGCPEDQRIQVSLSADASSIIDLSLFAPLFNSSNLILPAPTIIGYPADENAYRALRRIYASRVVAKQIVSEADYKCCERSSFANAIIDLQLVRLGLANWPLNISDYQQLVNDSISLQHIGRLFQLDGRVEQALGTFQRPVAYAFIGFLVDEQDLIALDSLIRALSTSGRFETWLEDVTLNRLSPDQLEAEWASYLRQKAGQ